MAYGVAAYGLWGLFPLYWPLLLPAQPVEILGHRMVWTLLTMLAVLTVLRQWAAVRGVLRSGRTTALLAVAGVLIGVNWGLFIHGVNTGHVVEIALGYFINPLVTVLLGVIVLRERLRPVQWVAIGLGAVAVAVLAADYGRPPWLALAIAGTFAGYGYLKKSANVGTMQSLSIETAVLFLPALAYLAVLHAGSGGTWGTSGRSYLLATTGIVTAAPLLFFGAAATRVPLSTMGLLQYLAPVLQFLIGVAVYGEQMPPARWAGFSLVWLALVLLSADALRAGRTRARLRPRRVESAA